MALHEAVLESNSDVVFAWDPSVSKADASGRKVGSREASCVSLAKKSEIVNQSRLKRAVDFTGALFGLVLLAPLLLMVALLIKLDTPGPVFFRQQRYGQGRTPFHIYKFRSMNCMESSGSFRQAKSDDARVTRVGRVLRRTSIDEVPQLINVLKGEMSLVGPRPHALAMDDAYDRTMPNYADRHLVRPGLTGLAQVEGYRGPTTEDAQISGRVRLDRAYIRTWSIAQDIRILFYTPFKLFDRGVF